MKSRFDMRPSNVSARLLASLLLTFACTVTANAQSVVDPYSVEFVPSPDHNATANGVPVVSGYNLEFYVVGDPTPLRVVDIGKPAPASDGKIHVNFVPTWPVTSVTYEARVAAVGPSGTADSTPSNQ